VSFVALGRYGFLLRELVRRDFTGRYAGSLLGVIWSFAQPLWLLALYSFVFSTVMNVSLLFERSDNFSIWMFCGLLPWMAIQESLTRGATVVTDNANLVKKLNFPSEILVVSLVSSALLHEVIAGGVFLAVLSLLGLFPGTSLFWLFPAMACQVLMTLGLAMLTAGVHVFFRDMSQVLGMLLNAWFFLTPIVYPPYLVEAAHPALAAALTFNPLTTLTEIYRCAFLGGGADAALLWGLLRLALFSVVLFGVGTLVYRRLEPTFVDLI
jgi:lipopolysaccharide transport system permease protein